MLSEPVRRVMYVIKKDDRNFFSLFFLGVLCGVFFLCELCERYIL
jgi:hypothetical protein